MVYAPVEAGLLKALFASNAIAAFGFAEELPFTDVIPTFTLSWCLANLWPTTGLAKRLVPDLAKKNTLLPAGRGHKFRQGKGGGGGRRSRRRRRTARSRPRRAACPAR